MQQVSKLPHLNPCTLKRTYHDTVTGLLAATKAGFEASPIIQVIELCTMVLCNTVPSKRTEFTI